jgi:hypothetical protein
MLRNRCTARSRRRNGGCEFSARLLSPRPTSWRSALPTSLIAAEIAALADDLHKDLVQMPSPLRIAARARDPLLADLGGEHRAKPAPPKPDGLRADVDPTLGQEIVDVVQRQRVSHVHHHDQTDDLRRAVEISERVAHAPSLPRPEALRAFGLTEPRPETE